MAIQHHCFLPSKKLITSIATLLLMSFSAYAQSASDSIKNTSIDSVKNFKADSIKFIDIKQQKKLANKERRESLLTPKRVALYAAILPSSGQIINKQYWKLPIVYGAAAVAGYYIYDNSTKYNAYRRAYIARISNDPEGANLFPDLSLDYLQIAMNEHRQSLDMSVVVSAGIYALQIIDALVFANLKGFDISEDISLKVRPVSYPTGGAGFGLVMNF